MDFISNFLMMMIVDCKKNSRNIITPEPMKGVVWQTVAVVKLRQPAHP